TRARTTTACAPRLRRTRQTPDQHLKDAPAALLSGKRPKTPATVAVGCPIVRDQAVKKDGKVTYYKDVLPILQNHCQQCHRPGEVGPFSLMTYRQAVNWADDIRTYTQKRVMPPWKPSEGLPFHNERRLSDKELDTLAAWVDGKTPAGDPNDAPPAKK